MVCFYAFFKVTIYTVPKNEIILLTTFPNLAFENTVIGMKVCLKH